MMSSGLAISQSLTLSSLCGFHYQGELSYQVKIFGEFQASTLLAQQFHLGDSSFPRCVNNSSEAVSVNWFGSNDYPWEIHRWQGLISVLFVPCIK